MANLKIQKIYFIIIITTNIKIQKYLNYLIGLEEKKKFVINVINIQLVSKLFLYYYSIWIKSITF